MRNPTWDELRACNVAAAQLNLSGSMRAKGPTDTGPVDDEFSFWHGRGGRWWIERPNGVVFASSTPDSDVPVARMVGGQMVYQRTTSSIVIGRVFGPRSLFGPRSVLVVRGRGLRAIKPPQEVDVDGRHSWAVMTATPSGTVTELVFDDRTGVVVRVASDDHDMFLEVTDLAEHDELPVSRFQFVGPVIEPHERTSFLMTW